MKDPLEIDVPRVPEDELLAELAAEEILEGKEEGVAWHLDSDGKFFLDVLHSMQKDAMQGEDAPELEEPSAPAMDSPVELLKKVQNMPASTGKKGEEVPELEPGKQMDDEELAFRVAQLIAGTPPILPE